MSFIGMPLLFGEVKQYLQQANFSHFEFRQTLFNPLENIKAVEPVKEGYGKALLWFCEHKS